MNKILQREIVTISINLLIGPKAHSLFTGVPRTNKGKPYQKHLRDEITSLPIPQSFLKAFCVQKPFANKL